ncbi:MAG: terpene cyclase/mutase family protein [Planctomycetia bacterium]|nr:MAG: terpene cyclase/mutase family protein [Planctomycetia bacterium]
MMHRPHPAALLAAVAVFALVVPVIAQRREEPLPSAAPPVAPTATAADPATATQPASAPDVSVERRAPVTRENVAARAQRVRARAAEFLLASQSVEGGWGAEHGPGVTALVVRALAGEPRIGPRHEAVRRGVAVVLRSQRADGGIHADSGVHANYETSVALSMLAALGKEAPAGAADRAQQFLLLNQWDESEQKPESDVWYGGAGYGSGKRPDLSNLQIMLDALHDSGLPKDDPAYRKALVFISRCQMRGESNDQPFAKGASDGGFIYSPANGGESKAVDQDAEGRTVLRSYGSMTYAGFKSMIYCGLTRDDPRVKAALAWIQRHWTLDHNPNMPERQSHEGLFYYYHTFARALAAGGEDVIEDHVGRRHDWRVELVAKLESLQRSDGSFVNERDRWMEGLPSLVTAYAMLALQAAVP